MKARNLINVVSGGGWKSLKGNFHCASSRVMVLEEGLENQIEEVVALRNLLMYV
jgi:hypothetical protein